MPALRIATLALAVAAATVGNMHRKWKTMALSVDRLTRKPGLALLAR